MKSNKILSMESRAPALIVRDWVRGEALASFQPGKVYILGFCGTSCDSCDEAMLKLIELQETYKDRGVEVVAVVAHEGAASADEARAYLEAWSAQFPELNFRVAFDTGAMDTLWMEPSFSVEIPQAFVIDRDGYIAFIGNPYKLHDVLPQVLGGTWRTSAQAQAAERERIAKDEPKARKKALKKQVKAKFAAAEKIEDWKKALAAIEEGVVLDPDNLLFRQQHIHLLLHKMHDMQTGLPLLRQLIRDGINTNYKTMLEVAFRELFDPAHDYSQFPSVERFAIGKELSEHILAEARLQDDYNRAVSYLMVAWYYHASGKKDRAVELLELALLPLDGPGPDGLKDDLLQTLADYKGEK
ncbi:redoxin family protein [Sinorhizobium medicae]|uniref:redoxin family protein n=1 Tax=Sinorhizobium medicae TaxID=110321 RepID=UPI000FDC3BB7|nr:redoxin family protein [Sinorhizobium medicae]MDX0617524.1 redoxin family protein [Sinorhizobium medicae]MDX1090817.1 redoxin family protein [Sinorhizobium medicae]MDX1158983.1 redoxin family protein [Sinorhizobium medicae]RVJ31355.1 TlpA family protein disulfide reductase [Sinorhizobium medicae]